MKNTKFFLIFILLLFITISCNNCSSHTGNSTLIISVDTTCVLYVDGISYGVLKNGDVKKVNVDKGEHLIIAKNLDYSEVLLRQTDSIKDSASKVIDLKITGIKIPVVSNNIDTLKPKDNANTNNNTNVTQSNPEPTTVKIGKQVWMAKNLNVSNYANGDAIPEAKTAEQWQKYGDEKKGCWCYYENKSANGSKYGKLYNWYAVDDSRGLAPNGWHIPSDAEWTKLTDFLGGEDAAGTKMKSTGGWNEKGNGTNTSGFAGLPGGGRTSNGAFSYIGDNGYWWSSTEDSAYSAWYRSLGYGSGEVNRSYANEQEGLSVRCLRDL